LRRACQCRPCPWGTAMTPVSRRTKRISGAAFQVKREIEGRYRLAVGANGTRPRATAGRPYQDRAKPKYQMFPRRTGIPRHSLGMREERDSDHEDSKTQRVSNIQRQSLVE
jgi:hypothetical protein